MQRCRLESIQMGHQGPATGGARLKYHSSHCLTKGSLCIRQAHVTVVRTKERNELATGLNFRATD